MKRARDDKGGKERERGEGHCVYSDNKVCEKGKVIEGEKRKEATVEKERRERGRANERNIGERERKEETERKKRKVGEVNFRNQ